MNVTASMAFRLVPDFLRTQPVFLCIDDTIVPKSETKFEDVSVLFDHAAHRGSSYLNGHCFVSLMLCVPVWKKDKISWLSVPLGYRMWTKQKSKLELAADMIRQVMPECQKQKNVILLCDSWYMKKPLVSIPEEYPNLDMIGNVRADSILYNLPPERTGRKGRPAGHGKQLSIETDFIFSDKKIDGYFIAVRPVVTNLFGNRSGIERMVNLINIAYCAMKILPYQDKNSLMPVDNSALCIPTYYTKKGKKITVRNLSQLKTVIFHFYSSSNSSSSISSV
ncbi:MAG: transposase [Lachnospiraceae bacterium]